MDQVAQLCRRAKAGDAVAASEMVSLFYEKVFSWFRRLCGNDEDAEDLTQKTFLKSVSFRPRAKAEAARDCSPDILPVRTGLDG